MRCPAASRRRRGLPISSRPCGTRGSGCLSKRAGANIRKSFWVSQARCFGDAESQRQQGPRRSVGADEDLRARRRREREGPGGLRWGCARGPQDTVVSGRGGSREDAEERVPEPARRSVPGGPGASAQDSTMRTPGRKRAGRRGHGGARTPQGLPPARKYTLGQSRHQRLDRRLSSRLRAEGGQKSAKSQKTRGLVEFA